MLRLTMMLSVAATALVPVAAPAQTTNPPAVAPMTAEEAIREINKRWLELIRTGNAEGVARLYTENGALMPPNAPVALGRSAIEQGWRAMMEMPGFALTFEPEEIVVSSSGDMAYDRGTYRFRATPPGGAIDDVGKYLVVWRNVGGEWQVAADIFNSDNVP